MGSLPFRDIHQWPATKPAINASRTVVLQRALRLTIAHFMINQCHDGSICNHTDMSGGKSRASIPLDENGRPQLPLLDHAWLPLPECAVVIQLRRHHYTRRLPPALIRIKSEALHTHRKPPAHAASDRGRLDPMVI
jgi:hypothetical protein